MQRGRQRSLRDLLTELVGDAADAVTEAVAAPLHVGDLAHRVRLQGAGAPKQAYAAEDPKPSRWTSF